VSEIDDKGNMLSTFTDVKQPRHLSTDMTGHVLVADYGNHRILLLDSQLQLERVLIDTNSQVKPWHPYRLHLNELTSQLYVLHSSSSEQFWRPDIITQWSLRWLTNSTFTFLSLSLSQLHTFLSFVYFIDILVICVQYYL